MIVESDATKIVLFIQKRHAYIAIIIRSTLFVGDIGQHQDDGKELSESGRKSDRSFKRKREHKEQNGSPSPDLEEEEQSLKQQIRAHKRQGPLSSWAALWLKNSAICMFEQITTSIPASLGLYIVSWPAVVEWLL